MGSWAAASCRSSSGHPGVTSRQARLPAELYDALPLRAGAGVLEIGAGSGLVRGAAVTCVEPDPGMAAHLRRTLPDAQVVESAFEDADLPHDRFDLAVAGTSFHWVDPRRGLPAVHRTLRPGGTVALWWMLFDRPTEPDAFTRTAARVFRHPPRAPDQADGPAWRDRLAAAGFVDVEDARLSSTVVMDAAGVRALYATLAVVSSRPVAERVGLLDAVETAVRDEFGGRVERELTTYLYTGRRA